MDPSPVHLWAFGVAQLLLGRHEEAVRDLTEASVAAPASAAIHSDLAAAYLQKSEGSALPLQDVAKAADAAERALSIDAILPEGRFNRALALARAGLHGPAIQAWNEFLAVEPNGPWADEARERLHDVRSNGAANKPCTPTAASNDPAADVGRCPQEARDAAERGLFAWARATLDGNARIAAEHLGLVERAGAALHEVFTDSLLRDAVIAIRRQPRARQLLARAHQEFEDGRMLVDSDRRHEAAERFRRSHALFRRAGSPYWVMPQHQLATLHTHRRELPHALDLLAEIKQAAARNGYKAARARAEWLTGVVTLQRGDASGALEHYRLAADLFEEIGERGNVSNVKNAAADTERILGNRASGWEYLSAAFTSLDRVADPTRRYLAYYNASLFSLEEGLARAALHFQDQALATARTRPGRGAIVEATINKAGVLGAIGRLSTAEASLAEAEKELPALGDSDQRAYMAGRITATRGEFLIAHDPARAASELEAAARYFSVVEPAEIPKLLLLKGRALARLGRHAEAAAAWDEGIRTFEARLDRLMLDQQRISYADQGWELYRRLFEEKVRQGRLNEALAVGDRGRSRMTGGSSESLAIDPVPSSLSPVVALVSYTVLERETHAWVFTAAGVKHHRIGVGEAELESHASAVLTSMDRQRSRAVLDVALEKLYDTVVAPLAIPESIRIIVLIPDGPLRRVPFAALRPTGERFLVQRYAIGQASSLQSIVKQRAPSSSRRPLDGDVLVVGQPMVDARRWPHLAPLPAAAGEAASVAALYPHSTLLVEGAATRSAVLSRLRSSDVFHFAGHAIANEVFPELSRLVLTPEPAGTGDLFARDVRDAGLRRGATVVLSACRTGVGPMRRAAGVQSIAQAFLSAGAGTVIASAWDIEDLDASELMTAFHRYLAGGASGVRALQAAQLAMIDAREPMSAWAAFAAFVDSIPATDK